MKFSKKTLPNGVRLITVPMADNPSATVLVMVEAGSKYETREQNGISHFLEHMIFKGTPKRPNASDISRELDSIGAHYNAFTTQEFTGYYAKADARHLDRVIDIVSDMCQNPLFPEAEIKKESGVIVEELRMYNDLPQRHVHDVINRLLHGDQPAGWDVIGTEQNIRSFTHDSFMKYRADHYVGSATIVIVSGSFDEKTIESKITTAFSAISTANKQPKLPVKQSQTEPAIMCEAKDTDQTHLVIATRTFDVMDPRMPIMQVLSTVLGGGMSSRLFQKMRDQLGICYYVRTSHNAYTDHGEITISAGVDNSRVELAVKELLAECSRLKDELVPEAELKKAKDYLSGTTMLELETSDARAEFVGVEEVLRRKLETPDEVIAKIQAVTAAQIQELAREVFVNKGLNLALIGRTKAETLKPILRFK
ncbi:MAG TPA: pitrilysin family protein [Candidatus Paceibacterota bacterium]